MINIKDTGADPSRSDNTAQIQAAIYLAQATDDKIIQVPAGTFTILGRLKDYNGITFVGCTSAKHYWKGTNNVDNFSYNASVLKGNYTQELFEKGIKEYWVTMKNLGFTGFTRLVEAFDCRSFEFDRCSFKNMTILNKPSNETGKYQNFNFRNCAFTIYNLDGESFNRTPFMGRIEDCSWIDNIFAGNKGFDLVQARANRILENRFEWIDRDAAISLYACDNNMIKDNWFDRIAGAAIQLKQLNMDIVIDDNVFSRCGGQKSSSDQPLNYGEAYKSFLNIWGDQKGNLKIDNNLFIKGPISDNDPTVVAPKYVIGLEPIGSTTQRKFSFKGNRFADGNGYTDSLIYGDSTTYLWLPSNTVIDTESAFDHLNDAVVDLAKWSSNKLVAYNTKAVTVKEIPENLIVNQNFDASITIPTNKQTGVVYGGKVNGIRRFGKAEQLHENTTLQTVNASVLLNKCTYTVTVTKALQGAPVYIVANYNTEGTIDGNVEVEDVLGNVIGTLPSLSLTNGTQKMYVAKFVVPETHTDSVIRLRFYAAKTNVRGTTDKVNINAFCATYGDWITRGTIDINNV